MTLDKFVKHMKIAFTDRLVPALYAFSAVSMPGILIYDKYVLNNENLSRGAVATLIMTGGVLFGAITKHVLSHLDYKLVKYDYEKRGFRKDIMTNKTSRRKAKIYAEESGRIPKFEEALKKYVM